MGEPAFPLGEFRLGQRIEKERIGERAELAFEATGYTRSAGGERDEAGEGLAGAGDGDFLAGCDPGEEARELGLGFVDVDDGGERRSSGGGSAGDFGGLTLAGDGHGE